MPVSLRPLKFIRSRFVLPLRSSRENAPTALLLTLAASRWFFLLFTFTRSFVSPPPRRSAAAAIHRFVPISIGNSNGVEIALFLITERSYSHRSTLVLSYAFSFKVLRMTSNRDLWTSDLPVIVGFVHSLLKGRQGRRTAGMNGNKRTIIIIGVLNLEHKQNTHTIYRTDR